MGRNIYGAEAASINFFNKPSSFLSESNAALLAAVLPNPLKYSAKTPSNYLLMRRNKILTNMRRLGGIDFLEEIYN